MRVFNSKSKVIKVDNVVEHKMVYDTLNILTYLLATPVILLEGLMYLIDNFVCICSWIRHNIVQYLFKMFYWNELDNK